MRRLQEQYLSRRTIVFVNGQAYFRCRTRLWSEDTCAEFSPTERDEGAWTTNIVALAQDALDTDDDPERFYIYLQECIWRFQKRSLSFDDDAINAMAGILTRISSLGGIQIWQGVLEAWLPFFLVFASHEYHQGTRRRGSFPSWSWAGWAGQIDWYSDVGTVHCEFQEVDHDGATRSLWRPDESIEARMKPKDRRGLLNSPQTVPPWMSRSYHLLKFKTTVLKLRWMPLMESLTPVFDKSRVSILVDKTLQPVGLLFCDDCGTIDLPKGALQFAVLGKDIESQLFSQRYMDRKQIVKQFLRPPLAWVMYLVHTNGVRERRGLGIVSQGCLQDSLSPGPRQEIIFLG